MPVVLITGANGGFGFHGAMAFARSGYTVYATVRDVSNCAQLRNATDRDGLSIHVRELDLTQPAEFSYVVANIVAESGRIDILVNNAGILRAGTAEDTPEGDLRLTMETNFFGPVLLTKAVLPYMRKQNSGLIIVVGSLSGMAGLPGDFSYTASKFALEGAVESMRHEVDRWGIKVALVEAGMYATGILDASIENEARSADESASTSPYAALTKWKLRNIKSRMAEAFDPRAIGELFVEIAKSDADRFRWAADPVAEKVMTQLFAMNDEKRDQFLVEVSGSQWWSDGLSDPDGPERDSESQTGGLK